MISFAREGCLAGYRRITVGEWLLKEYGHIFFLHEVTQRTQEKSSSLHDNEVTKRSCRLRKFIFFIDIPMSYVMSH